MVECPILKGCLRMALKVHSMVYRWLNNIVDWYLRIKVIWKKLRWYIRIEWILKIIYT